MKKIITKTVKQVEAKHLMINNKSYAISNKSKNFSKFGYLIVSGIVATFTNSTKVLEQIKRKHQLAKIYTIAKCSENYIILSYTVLNNSLDYETKKEIAYFCNFDKNTQSMVCFDDKANREHKKHELINSLLIKYQFESDKNQNKQILINILMSKLVLKGYTLNNASETFTKEYTGALYSTTHNCIHKYIVNDLNQYLNQYQNKINYHKKINKIAKYVKLYKKASSEIKGIIAYNLYNYLTIVKCNDNWENISNKILNILDLNAIEAIIYYDEHNNYYRMKKDNQLKKEYHNNNNNDLEKLNDKLVNTSLNKQSALLNYLVDDVNNCYTNNQLYQHIKLAEIEAKKKANNIIDNIYSYHFLSYLVTHKTKGQIETVISNKDLNYNIIKLVDLKINIFFAMINCKTKARQNKLLYWLDCLNCLIVVIDDLNQRESLNQFKQEIFKEVA